MASNPVVVTCTKDTWVKVATGVTVGMIHKMSTAPHLYKQTYRVTLGAAPTNDADAVVAFYAGNELSISADAGVDVYIKAVGAEGSVRVDL